MSFLKKKATVQLSFQVEENKTESVKRSIEKIAASFSPEELELLAKVADNPLLKNIGLSELKKRV